MKTDILRKKYLSFFKKKDHKVLSSASLVPEDDPTLLFTGAGMNQFKEQFRGNVGSFKRAATAQKCLRTDDLEKVGKTPAHHTFFEMLGNFSFGDYFKKEAIVWAWEFLIKELNLPSEKLWISVYKKDEEAFNYWHKTIGVSREKIVKLGEVENFWPSNAIKKGPNGPCGPCSEIFYDQGKDAGCRRDSCSPACSCGRFVEIWNLVFTQFERKEGGKLEPLPNKNIDTGMGLERMAAVMQGVLTNFEIDILRPIVDFICSETGANYEKDIKKKADIYCICDHIRAVTFAICENILPSNEERGYVIRKLIRKSSMHARNLGKKEPFLYKIVPVIAQMMHNPYPELKKRQENISSIILSEEKRFLDVLRNAKNLVESKFSQPGINTGTAAFELYDTFGLPLAVSKEMAKKLFNLEIDEESFTTHFTRRKDLSKAGSKMKGEIFAGGLANSLGGIKKTQFLGYETIKAEAKILLILEEDNRKKALIEGQKGILVLDKSPFYAEKGGQASDKGEILTGDSVFKVENTKIYNDIILHLGCMQKGKLEAGDKVLAEIDEKRRINIAKHHTATHLLQSALKCVLGEHVEQAGSSVSCDRLRFDFTHFEPVDEKQLQKVDDLVNEYIKTNFKVEAKILSKAEAIDLGAIALFGEKYGEVVRMIVINKISKELCGGTHLDFTGVAGLFKIIRESGVSAGVRRIEAVCGDSAVKKMKEKEEISKIEKLKRELEKKKKDLIRLRDKNINSKIGEITGCAADNGLIIKEYFNLSPDTLRSISKAIERELSSYVIILFSKFDERKNIYFVISISKDNIARGLSANILSKEIVKNLSGSGGGRADFAQGGVKNSEKLGKFIEELPKIIRGYLK